MGDQLWYIGKNSRSASTPVFIFQTLSLRFTILDRAVAYRTVIHIYIFTMGPFRCCLGGQTQNQKIAMLKKSVV